MACARPDRIRRHCRALLATSLCALALCVAPAHASGGSYASAGSGTYAASLWWLDFAGYSSALATGGGQAYSWSLPGGAGTLSSTLTVAGNGTLVATASPAWSGGGAFGHGAYNNLTGSPALYWLNQPGSPVTLTLGSLVVRDAAGYARSYALYAADGENTNSPETIVYTSTAPWKLVDTVNYYASYTGGVPALAGAGTATATESAPTTKDSNYNGSLVVGTLNPSRVSVALTNNEAVLFAVAMPTVTLTVNVSGRIAPADQFTAVAGYTSPASTIRAASTSGVATSATTGALPVIGTNSLTLGVTMLSGSPSALAYYTGSIACANSGAGAASFAGANTPLPTGAGTSFTVTPQGGDNISCTLTVSPAAQGIAGSVYLDTNHDAALDNGEAGTGLAGLYVKLAAANGTTCASTASAVASVDAASGAYSFAGVSPGSYCVILTNSAATANVTPYLPAGYLGTEAATGQRIVNVGAGAPAAQNFGLYGGSAVAVVVYDDNGSAAGVANDGVQNGGEAGLAGVVVNASSAGSVVASATTSGAGAALLWLPASVQGATVTLSPTPPSGYLATGASTGNSGGSYVRPALTFKPVAGSSIGGVAFGLIAPNTFAPDGAQSAQPGTTLYYAHTFVAASAGQLAVATTATASPVLAGWSEVLYLDPGCTGQYVAGDPVLAAPLAVVAGQTVCVLLREFVPANAASGAQNKVSVSATLTYSGTAAPAPATALRTDTTSVGAAGGVTLQKQVQNLTLGTAYGTNNSAAPGQTLQYQLTISNQGSAALASVTVSDSTPAYTTYLGAACPGTLPVGLTACSVTAQPAVGGQGGLLWSFAGTMAPGSQTAVTYQVQVAP